MTPAEKALIEKCLSDNSPEAAAVRAERLDPALRKRAVELMIAHLKMHEQLDELSDKLLDLGYTRCRNSIWDEFEKEAKAIIDVEKAAPKAPGRTCGSCGKACDIGRECWWCGK